MQLYHITPRFPGAMASNTYHPSLDAGSRTRGMSLPVHTLKVVSQVHVSGIMIDA